MPFRIRCCWFGVRPTSTLSSSFWNARWWGWAACGQLGVSRSWQACTYHGVGFANPCRLARPRGSSAPRAADAAREREAVSGGTTKTTRVGVRDLRSNTPSHADTTQRRCRPDPHLALGRKRRDRALTTTYQEREAVRHGVSGRKRTNGRPGGMDLSGATDCVALVPPAGPGRAFDQSKRPVFSGDMATQRRV